MAGDLKTSQLQELLKAGVADSDLFAVVSAGQSKKFKMSTLFSLVADDIAAAITAFQESFGILALGASESIPNVLDTTFTKIKIVDITSFDKSNGHMTHSFIDFNTTINTDGIYDLSLFSAFLAPNNSLITVARYKNDQPILGAQLEFTGAGTKAVPVSGELFLELVAGDVIDIRAKADGVGVNIETLSAQLRVEKTHH